MDLMELDPIIEAALYKPLQEGEIRLALLESGMSDSSISVHLVPVNINASPEYDAISYVWGSAGHVVPICCGGTSANITVSLHWALMKVRLPDQPRLIWADALCINQNDARERSQQVALMGRIYSSARFVMACMGNDPDHGAANVASLLNDYGPLLARPAGTSDLLQLWRMGCTPEKDGRWPSIRTILGLPWFRRAWVLQEVGLAKNPRVIYGSAEFSYRDLMTTIQWIRSFAAEFAAKMGIGALLIHTQWLDWTDNWTTTAYKHYKLVDLLDHGALLDCQDPRDHIYAFLVTLWQQRLG
ncbi:heterokaryon incompatibility protein-domain-containing protein [Xylariales sp. AK1849]|nr:heterokaryon incompatibility protein-domain-containing protein [Xylariales sp. AK1849]